MDTRARHRLIGATVLVSLGVIFIPMIFDDPPFDSQTGERRPVPEPSGDGVTLAIPIALPGQPANEPRVVEQLPLPAAQTSQREERAVPLVAASAPDSTAVPVALPAFTPTTGGETPVAPMAAPVRPTAEPTVVAATPSASPAPPAQEGLKGGWVIQLISYSKAEMAMEMRDKLRKAGYSAFVEEVRGGKGTLYRVRVGPELRDSEAKRLRDKLAKEFKLNGLVMRATQ